MRVGFNPNKDKKLPKSDYFHQIIMPVYIPNQDDYFKDAFKILSLSLESLFKTCHSNTYISVVNNGSCSVVSDYLINLQQKGKIQELINTSAIGKLNAIFKGLSGHRFPLITITDADVLFLNNWQKATYDVFNAFPQAGAIAPVPSPKMYIYHTANILSKYFLSKNLRFTTVTNPEGLEAFAMSIGNPKFYNEVHLSKYLTIEKSNIKAVLGAGHFVCTYRAEVFVNRRVNFSKYSLGGDSEAKFLDQSVIDKNLWRLSTADNFAYHMGNVFEDWMRNVLSHLLESTYSFNGINKVKIKNSKFKIWNWIFSKIMKRKYFRYLFLKHKGLTSEQANNY